MELGCRILAHRIRSVRRRGWIRASSPPILEGRRNNESLTVKNVVKNGLLSTREADVLRHCSRGLSNQEIADQLAITVGTTKGHLHRIFQKLKVRNRMAAAIKARKLGIR
jgi:DNA-binding NarL/FixJ family response regulator